MPWRSCHRAATFFNRSRRLRAGRSVHLHLPGRARNGVVREALGARSVSSQAIVEHPPDRMQERVGRVGLFHQGTSRNSIRLRDSFFGVAGQEDHRNPRAVRHDLHRQLRPAHPRHHHIGQHQVDGRWIEPGQIQRGDSVLGFQNVVAIALQDDLGQLAQRRRVFHQQNGLAASGAGHCFARLPAPASCSGSMLSGSITLKIVPTPSSL